MSETMNQGGPSTSKRPLRIALVGRSGAGKSEVAKLLAEKTGSRIIKTGQICRQISQLLFGNDDKSSTQALDDALTQIDSSIFLRAALRDVPEEEQVIIDALRFRTDVELAGARSILIRVIATDKVRINRLRERGQIFDAMRDGAHRSEIELDDLAVDLVIRNDGDLHELSRVVEAEALKFL